MEHLLNQTLTIYEKSSKPDKWGSQLWVMACQVPCRFTRIFKRYLDSKGKVHEITGSFQIQEHLIAEGNKIIFQNREYTVLTLNEWRDYAGEIFGYYVECKDFQAAG